nr:UbiA family prenyltransferase [Candidatus Cloacimonadota bacterium]
MSFLKIIRPFNCLFVAITVFFGASYHNNSITFSPVIFAILSAGLIAAAGYVINDFFDLKIDLVNKPSRILPSGRMNPKTAYLFSIALFLIGIFVSLFTRNRFCIAIAFINSLILFYYAKSLKSKLFVGNIVVSYAAASTFIFGGFSSGNFKNSLIIAVFAFLYTLIREMIKDAE